MVVTIISVLALLGTLAGVYYARGHLREARRVREENDQAVARQRQEDDLWSGKFVGVAQTLCRVAPRFIQGNANSPGGDGLCLLFPDPVLRTRILSHLIEKQTGLSYMMRPFDIAQLRLKPMRELIDLVLKRIEEYKVENADFAGRMGLE